MVELEARRKRGSRDGCRVGKMGLMCFNGGFICENLTSTTLQTPKEFGAQGNSSSTTG
jgi:hypothetical protein